MADARLLTEALRAPADTLRHDGNAWNVLLRMARAEKLLATLASRLRASGMWDRIPSKARDVLQDDEVRAAHIQRRTDFEMRQALLSLRGCSDRIILLKGAAYLAMQGTALAGRHIGDVDLLVARDHLAACEAGLARGGWELIKDDPYDDAYYREHMHELPPRRHPSRGSVVDLHHTILPLTARLRPDAAALIADAVPAGDMGAYVLSPPDMLLHSATHLFYDGDFEGGLRNLWDIHCLVGDFAARAGFWDALAARAQLHQLTRPLGHALRFARELYGTAVDARLVGAPSAVDALMRRRLLDRNMWGRRQRPLTGLAIYVRSHWLRMPPAMLARHLFTKWRKRVR